MKTSNLENRKIKNVFYSHLVFLNDLICQKNSLVFIQFFQITDEIDYFCFFLFYCSFLFSWKKKNESFYNHNIGLYFRLNKLQTC